MSTSFINVSDDTDDYQQEELEEDVEDLQQEEEEEEEVEIDDDEELEDEAEISGKKRSIVHYNFVFNKQDGFYHCNHCR